MRTTRSATAVATAVTLLALAGCANPDGVARSASPASGPVSPGPVSASPAAASPPPATTTPPVTTPPRAASPGPAAPGPACGVNLGASAVSAAVTRLRPAFADRPDVAWAPTADGGNYDPCATLSAASVGVRGATGSSPEQVLMFHDGIYQGTGTRAAHGFTSIDVAASTDDTVVVRYRYPRAGESNAGASGRATVRYRWSGGAVHMLDTLPTAITG